MANDERLLLVQLDRALEHGYSDEFRQLVANHLPQLNLVGRWLFVQSNFWARLRAHDGSQAGWCVYQLCESSQWEWVAYVAGFVHGQFSDVQLSASSDLSVMMHLVDEELKGKGQILTPGGIPDVLAQYNAVDP